MYSPSDSALGTLSHAASPYVAQQIGEYFKEQNKEGSVKHIAAHSLLGAFDASASGNNPLSAAIAAGGAEADKLI